MTLFTTNYYVQQVFSLDEQTKGVPGNNILDILLLIVKPLLSHGIEKCICVATQLLKSGVEQYFESFRLLDCFVKKSKSQQESQSHY